MSNEDDINAAQEKGETNSNSGEGNNLAEGNNSGEGNNLAEGEKEVGNEDSSRPRVGFMTFRGTIEELAEHLANTFGEMNRGEEGEEGEENGESEDRHHFRRRRHSGEERATPVFGEARMFTGDKTPDGAVAYKVTMTVSNILFLPKCQHPEHYTAKEAENYARQEMRESNWVLQKIEVVSPPFLEPVQDIPDEFLGALSQHQH